MDKIETAFCTLLEKIKQLEPSNKKEKLLIKALVISEMAGLGYSREIVDRLVENRKEME
ncbi:hypothetical protein SAMN04244560_00135 [Thermoanaerobacter thermohydrosulfuricus]|uniref:Uncharacterized protein n=1 Tax=Thermoanaerobacter thermohydrosulfuricus TaxID=1516 RepID=A0A1G7HRW3_THETY|nr:hypothetical protein [Thermoanaerobacter thermohydrosulfuricus]SDF03073.1 hypothetical protein SAMN04244560_00135 [Thermoanaerobacter thermohydrosulfuricus]